MSARERGRVCVCITLTPHKLSLVALCLHTMYMYMLRPSLPPSLFLSTHLHTLPPSLHLSSLPLHSCRPKWLRRNRTHHVFASPSSPSSPSSPKQRSHLLKRTCSEPAHGKSIYMYIYTYMYNVHVHRAQSVRTCRSRN